MKIKHFSSFMAVILIAALAQSASAYDFIVNELCYSYNYGYDGKSVTVTYQRDPSESNNWTSYSSLRGDLTIPSSVTYNGTTYSVTSINNKAFFGCSGMTSVTIPNSVTTIDGYAFQGCSGLTSVTIPNSVTSIGFGAFKGCKGLTSVIWNAKSFSSNDSYSPFRDLTNITSFVFGDEVEKIPNYLCRELTGLTSVTIPNSVTSIGCYAFYGCSGLTNVNIPNSVTTINDNAFCNCSGLTSVTIPSSVTSIGLFSVFSNCSSLESIVVESGNNFYDSRNNCNAIIQTATNKLIAGCKNTTIPNSLTSIGSYAFAGCSGLTSVIIPNSVTEIGDDAFKGCTGLTSITIPNSVTSIAHLAFYSCGLRSVTIGNSVTTIGSCAFAGCNDLVTIVVESGNTIYDSRNNCNAVIETATNNLIAGCKNTTIPNSVTSIGYAAFLECSDLKSITIPNSVTSIDYYAFENCSGMTSVTIPNSVTSINDKAFHNCSGLKSIYNYINHPVDLSLGYSVFYAVNVSDCILHVLKGRLEEYSNAEVWKDFKNIVDDIAPPVIPGDVSGDYQINVLDVTAIITYILGTTPSDFYVGNADLNDDDEIDVKDVTALINLILN